MNILDLADSMSWRKNLLRLARYLNKEYEIIPMPNVNIIMVLKIDKLVTLFLAIDDVTNRLKPRSF